MSSPSPVRKLEGSGSSASSADSPVDLKDEIHSRELVLGFCGAVGCGLENAIPQVSAVLNELGYHVVHIKVSDLIRLFFETEALEDLKEELENKGIEFAEFKHLEGFKRFDVFQDLGNKLRKRFSNDILAQLAVRSVSIEREKLAEAEGERGPGKSRVAYLINQIKHHDEVKFLRLVYPQLFHLFGVLAPEKERKKNLEELGVEKDKVNYLISRDRKEEKKYGQQLEKAIKDADFFVKNIHNNAKKLEDSIRRFIYLMHGVNGLTPTREENGMYAAFSASLSSACLSRQVGASVADSEGQILATGCNDVPKPGGGLYNSDGEMDHRCFYKGKKCYNDLYKNKLTDSLRDLLKQFTEMDHAQAQDIANKMQEESAISSLIEYSRAIHAEMDALLALSRSSIASSRGATLYSTTFPCHNCARHIVAAGISRVVYIEPYEKSLALNLHDDAITQDNEIGKVEFDSFEGVAPRKYQKFFTAFNDRKEKGTGKAITLMNEELHQTDPQLVRNYLEIERKVVKEISERVGHMGLAD